LHTSISQDGTNTIVRMDYAGRQKTFQQALTEQKLDGFVLTHAANLRYLCGYTGSNGLLLFLNGRRVFFTDGRYTEQAAEEVKGARIVIARGPLLPEATKTLAKARSATIGFEADLTTVTTAAQMKNLLPRRVKWKPTAGLIMRQRMIKDADELKLIRQAVNLGANVYLHAARSIGPGVSEVEVAGKLEFAARQAGADGMSFDTIVAAGKRGALPHGRASEQAIPKRGFVVVDSGVILRGYCSDMTRTVHVGRTSRVERQWYESVLQAQLVGIAAVRAGVMAWEVDEAVRKVLRRAKLEQYFTHSTGHGVGLEIHEPPRLGNKQTEKLAAGMVITIEPGVYVPGKGGIRIEDMVVVTETGCEVLTPVTKELIEVSAGEFARIAGVKRRS
jgi:Xaa-Pro aminopeptidase